MANPITWQNVEQSPYASYIAGNLLKGAGDSFASGVDQLKGVYTQYQADRSQENTAAYEAELAKYTTPEALKAARDSGVFAKLGSEYGIQMDPKVLRDGVRNADTRLTGDVTTAQAYADHVLTQQINPLSKSLPQKLADEQAIRDRATTAFNQSQTTYTNSQTDRARRLKLDGIADTEAERKAKESADQRRVDLEMASGLALHTDANISRDIQLGTYGATLGLPVTPAGRPDMAKISQDKSLTEIYNKALIDNPSLNQLSDTKAGNDFIDSLVKDGRFTTQQGVLAKQNLDKTFDSTRKFVGKDKDILATFDAVVDAKHEENLKKNSLFLLPAQGLDRVPEVIKAINDVTPDLDHQKKLQTEVFKWLKAGGINIAADGEKPVLVPISIPLIQQAAMASSSWFSANSKNNLWSNSGTDEPNALLSTKTTNFIDQVKAGASSSEYQKQLKHALEYAPGNAAAQKMMKRRIMDAQSGR